MLDPNLKVADLTDLPGEFPRETAETIGLNLVKTEAWEQSLWRDGDPLRYPSVVKNVRGSHADQRYYLYYAHHDIPSGIGCAIAEQVTGPYRKLAQLDPERDDSQVLRAKPHGLCLDNREEIKRALQQTQTSHRALNDYNHLASPCVVWNPHAGLWHMYFHSYRYLWPTGGGHQQTYLATCRDLSTHQWEILKNPDGSWKIVLPVTDEKWMNSGSSYRNVCVLHDGRFLAFLSGAGGEYNAGTWSQPYGGLGFAVSLDGIHWVYLPENPIFAPRNTSNGMIGYLGNDEYLAVWSENGKVTYGKTKDFKTIERDMGEPATWKGALICPWREGKQLFLFCHGCIHRMELPV